MIRKVCAMPALAAAALAFCASSPAKAIMITASPGGAPTNSSTISLAGPGADRAAVQSVSYTDLAASAFDSVGNTVDIKSRYISNAAADRPVAFSGGTARATITSNYNYSFTVTPIFSGTEYTITIDSRLTGALNILDDINGGTATASVSNVSGFLDNVANTGLNLASAASISGHGDQNFNVNQTNSLVLGPFMGPQTFNIRFQWTSEATSQQNALGADESAARFGANGPHSGNSADDYPGFGNRNQANDGHFVTVTATITAVPEPSTVALGGIGALGLALTAWRRRRR